MQASVNTLFDFNMETSRFEFSGSGHTVREQPAAQIDTEPFESLETTPLLATITYLQFICIYAFCILGYSSS